jgi:hypothetical protein
MAGDTEVERDSAQGNLERKALTNVRALVDKLEADDKSQPRRELRMFVIAGLAIALGLAALYAVYKYQTRGWTPRAMTVTAQSGPAATRRGTPAIGHIEIRSAKVGNALFQVTGVDEQGREYSETYDVKTSAERDPRRDIATRIVEVVTQHQGNEFKWPSKYLGRVVVLNCTPADHEKCVDFMMRDFFETPPAK